VNRGNYFLFFIASVVGGVFNAVAGGGGLITFPLLMLVTGTDDCRCDKRGGWVRLVSHGSLAYPKSVNRSLGSGWLWLLLVPSVLGGLMGALLLTHTGNRNFMQFVPWLILVATIIVALRPILVRRRESGSVQPDLAPMLWLVAMIGIFLVALYGGYFGTGIGILMIGALSFISPGEIRHVVALKNFLNGWMRGVAVFVLVLNGNVAWKYGAPMAIGGLVGGYIGGIVSHRANRTVVRSIVIGIGLAVSGHYFWKL
jgi:uncharacterized protein